MTCRESCYPVQATVDRLKAAGVDVVTGAPSSADAPARVAVWQEGDGTVWVGYRDAGAAIRTRLATAVSRATTPY